MGKARKTGFDTIISGYINYKPKKKKDCERGTRNSLLAKMGLFCNSAEIELPRHSFCVMTKRGRVFLFDRFRVNIVVTNMSQPLSWTGKGTVECSTNE